MVTVRSQVDDDGITDDIKYRDQSWIEKSTILGWSQGFEDFILWIIFCFINHARVDTTLG